MNNYPKVILYRYDGSPFAAKLDNILAYKGIKYSRVAVPMTLPRPDISDRLGIGYRRIPVLAIGNDVYCDTSLMIPTIERIFSEDKGYPTLFPVRKDGSRTDAGIIKAFAMAYTDRMLFPLAAGLLPYKKFPKAFIDDRSAWQGSEMNVDKAIAEQPVIKSTIVSHLVLLEEQLSDGREWLFDTKSPGYGDFSVHFIYSWIMYFRIMRDVLNADKFPFSVAWIGRMTDILNRKKEQNVTNVSDITGEEAARAIASSKEHITEVNFDSDEAERLGLAHKVTVNVTPTDNAKDYPTTGELIGLNREEIVLGVSGKDVPSLRCHFPRLNFAVKNTQHSRL